MTWLKLLILIATLSVQVTEAQDPATPYFDFAPLNPDQVHFSADLQYFQSTANYDDSGGAYEALPDNHAFQEINTRLRASYDIAPLWRLLAGARINSVTTDDATDTRNNSELNELQVGIVFAPVYQLSHRVYLEAIGLAALNEIPVDTDNAITGEGANRARIGARYAYLMGTLEFLASIHLDYLDDGRSARAPYTVGAQWRLGDLSLYGGLQGFFSVTNDEFSATPTERSAITDRVNGGSYRYYAIDPSLLDSQVHVDWIISEGVNLSLGLNKTLNGVNSAEGFGVIAGLAFRWGGSDASIKEGSVRKRRYRRRKGNRIEPEEDFELREERYDESLFRKQRKKGKKRRRRRKPIDVDGAIDSTIDDLE